LDIAFIAVTKANSTNNNNKQLKILWTLISETREVRRQRKVVLHLLKPVDFSSHVLQDIINSDQCIHLQMDCDRPLKDVDSWTG